MLTTFWINVHCIIFQITFLRKQQHQHIENHPVLSDSSKGWSHMQGFHDMHGIIKNSSMAGESWPYSTLWMSEWKTLHCTSAGEFCV